MVERVVCTRWLRPVVGGALAGLGALGMVNSDSFAGLRALLMPAEKRRRGRRRALFGMEDSGRWAMARRGRPPAAGMQDPGPPADDLAPNLRLRYGCAAWRVPGPHAA